GTCLSRVRGVERGHLASTELRRAAGRGPTLRRRDGGAHRRSRRHRLRRPRAACDLRTTERVRLKMSDKNPPEEGEALDEESFAFESEYKFEDWDDVPPEEASRILKGLEGLIPDVVKRTMSNVLWSDDGIRA